jgi:leucyl aminopeptidase
MAEKVDVFGVFHNDMTGYQPEDRQPIIAISMDNVDLALSKTLGIISNAYSGLPWQATKCGYGNIKANKACSDHASWDKYITRKTNS